MHKIAPPRTPTAEPQPHVNYHPRAGLVHDAEPGVWMSPADAAYLAKSRRMFGGPGPASAYGRRASDRPETQPGG